MSDPPVETVPRLQIIINNDVAHNEAVIEALVGATGLKPLLDSIKAGIEGLYDQAVLQTEAANGVIASVDALQGLLQPLLDTTNSSYNKQLETAAKISDIEVWTQHLDQNFGSVEDEFDSTLLENQQIISGAITSLLTAFGQLPSYGPATLMGKIDTIVGCGCVNGGPADGDCTAPFKSDRSAVATTYNEEWSINGVIALFPTPYPDGIGAPVETDDIIPFQSEAELISEVWEAFYVFVESSAEYFKIDRAGDEVYQTNQWVRLKHSPPNRFFWVELGHWLNVTICRDNAYTPDDDAPIEGEVTVEVPASADYTITRVVNVGGAGYGVKHLWEILGGSHLYIYHDMPLGASTIGVSYDAILTTADDYYEHAPGPSTVSMMGTNTLATTARISVPPEE